MEIENQSAKQADSQPSKLDKLRNKWLLYSGGGMTLTGLGLCLFGEALSLKIAGSPNATWVAYGVLSLVVFNAGLAVFGQGVVFKSQLDYKAERKRQKEKFGYKNNNNNNNRPRKPRPKKTNQPQRQPNAE